MRFKQYLSGFLAICVIMSGMVFGTTAFAADGAVTEIVFKDEFSSALDTSLWESHGEKVAEGKMLVPKGGWPTLKMPTLDAESTYRFSYKVMSDMTSGNGKHELLKITHSDAGNNGRSFGSYRPGYGFSFRTLNWGESNFVKEETGVWYTVEVEFCEKDGEQYTNWTVKDESGEVIFTDSADSLWNANASVATTASVSGAKIWFYNNADYPLDIYVDDVTLEKVLESGEGQKPGSKPLFEENFDKAENLAALQAGGIFSRGTKTELVDGVLEIAPDGYIYIDIKNKAENTAYKMTYDIMAPEKGNGKGGLNFYAEQAPAYSLGYYNAMEGFAGIKREFINAKYVVAGMVPGKWYTVKIEFLENATAGYISYTVTDRETQKVFGTIAPDKFEGQDSADMVSGKHTRYCLWNRDGSDVTYHIDNMKMELQGAKPIFNAEKVFIGDIAGNEITDLSAPITPGIAEIVLDFTTEVTQESADAGIKLIETDDKGNEKEISISGTIDGSKYIISVNEPLKSNSHYLIKVSRNIETAGGDKLPSDYTVEFETGEESFSVKGEGIYSDGKNISGLSEIKANATVTVQAKALNTTKNDEKIVVCVSYFKGNKMVNTSLQLSDINKMSGGIVSKDFTAPTDMTDIDSVQVVFWNSADGMLACCDAITISK